MTESFHHDGRVSEEELARVRSKIGQKIKVNEPAYLTEVTRDAIRHWAWATGDKNPLFLDEAYAKQSAVGQMIAPPCMLYAFSRTSIGYRGGLPGVHSFFAGSHFRWKEPIPLGETIDTDVTFKDLVELPSRFADRMFKQISHIRFLGKDGREIADAESWGMRTERTKAKEKGKYNSLKFHHYTKEELAEIAKSYEQEVCRGSAPLFWEDVQVGDELPSIVRGPYTATVAVAFEQAWGGLFIWAHSYWFKYLRRHPAAGILNGYGIPEPPEAVHWDSALAKSVGVPEAYDYGPERISWLGTMLTNWAGDQGFLAELYCEIRRFNLVGDVTYAYGKIVEKTSADTGRGSVKIELGTRDQRGEMTSKGWARILLPMKSTHDSPG